MDPAQSAPRLDNYFASGEQPHDPGRIRIHIGRSLILFFLLFIVVGIGTSISLTVYRRVPIPGLSPQKRLVLVKALARLPLLPKTPEQILLTAFDRNIRLTKYATDFSFSGALHSSGVAAGSLDLHIRGPIDYSDVNNVTFDVAASFSANLAGTTYQGSTILRKSGETIYAKIDTLSDSIIDAMLSLSSLFGNAPGDPQKEEARKREIRDNITALITHWIAYDTSGVTSEARKQLNEISNEESIPATLQKQASDFLLQGYILPEVQRLDDENIDNTPVYHLRLEPSKKLLTTILEKAYEAYEMRAREMTPKTSTNVLPMTTGPTPPAPFRENLQGEPLFGKEGEKEEVKKAIALFVESLEDARMDLYIGKSDRWVRRSSWQTSINFSKLAAEYGKYADDFSSGNTPFSVIPFSPSMNELSSAKLSMASTFSLHDIGKAFSVETPKEATSPASFLQLALEALKTKAEKAYEEQKDQWEDDFRRLNTLLLRYYGSHNSTYPLTIAQAATAYLPADDPLRLRLTDYTYQRSPDGKSYLLYVDDPFASTGNSSWRVSVSDTTLYGITSEYTYARYLDKQDIDRLLATPTPTPTATALPAGPLRKDSYAIYALNQISAFTAPATIRYAVDVGGTIGADTAYVDMYMYRTPGPTPTYASIQLSNTTIGSSGDKLYRGTYIATEPGTYVFHAVGKNTIGKVSFTTAMTITVFPGTPTPSRAY